MPHVVNAILITLSVLSLIAFFYWGIGFLRTLRTRRLVPSARDGLGLRRGHTPRVCVVIAAHNEEHAIEGLARSLLSQDYPIDRLHIVFALDRCSDRTAAILRGLTASASNVTIFENAYCPEGWAGKVHALHRAVTETAAAREADLLLFADADTRFDPRCISACVNLMLTRQKKMISLLSTLTTDSWYERLIQPATTLELLRQYPPLRTNKGLDTRAMANGQFMLFDRATYEAIGGHRAVKDELLEDMALAYLVKQLGAPSEVYFASGMLTCHMYESWPAFIDGWRRLYIDLAGRRPKRLAKAAIGAAFFGTILPLAAIAAITLGAAGIFSPPAWWGGWWVTSVCAWVALISGCMGFVSTLACLFAGLSESWSRPGWFAGIVAYPLGAAATAWLLLTARRDLVRGVPLRWGGREYVRQPRGKHGHARYQTNIHPEHTPSVSGKPER